MELQFKGGGFWRDYDFENSFRSNPSVCWPDHAKIFWHGETEEAQEWACRSLKMLEVADAEPPKKSTYLYSKDCK